MQFLLALLIHTGKGLDLANVHVVVSRGSSLDGEVSSAHASAAGSGLQRHKTFEFGAHWVVQQVRGVSDADLQILVALSIDCNKER